MAPTIQSAGAHRTARKFVEKFNIARFHDVGGTQGICHQVVADQGFDNLEPEAIRRIRGIQNTSVAARNA